MTQAGYVYKRSESQLWTVGHYVGGDWHPESDHDSIEKAARRVRYLNGGDITTKHEHSPLDIIAEQLTRIADALQLTALPDLRTLTANSLPDVPHRNEVTGHLAPIDEQLSEVSARLHDCTQPPERFSKGDLYCGECPDRETCVHTA